VGADRSGWSCERLGVYRALLLDVAYQPVDILRWSKAVAMDYLGKAEVLDYYEDYVRSAREVHFLPSVMRLDFYVDKAAAGKRLAPTRRNVLLRDNFECQYCGEAGAAAQLTLDHVVPVSKGGADTWENLTTACSRCNQRKGDAPLDRCGLKLRRAPRRPSTLELCQNLQDELELPEAWCDYLPGGRGHWFLHARRANHGRL